MSDGGHAQERRPGRAARCHVRRRHHYRSLKRSSIRRRCVLQKPPNLIKLTFPPCAVTTAEAQAPLWLLNACSALDFLTSEHPKVMTTLSAVLITVGSLPALPGISTAAANSPPRS